MKNGLLILIGAVAVVGAAAFFFMRGSEAPVQPTAAASTPALATALAPDMTLITASSSEPQTVGSSTPTYAGDTLATSHTGRGLLQWANGTVASLITIQS